MLYNLRSRLEVSANWHKRCAVQSPLMAGRARQLAQAARHMASHASPCAAVHNRAGSRGADLHNRPSSCLAEAPRLQKTPLLRVRHQNERRRGVGLAVGGERHRGGRPKLLAHEERRVLLALPREDEVVRHAVSHVRVALLVFVLLVIAHAQPHAPVVMSREGHRDCCARGEVQRFE
eukprot:UN2893